MDPKLEEILQITKDTNRMVHKMRRSQLWGRVFTVVIWIVVVFGPLVAYYFYFQQYVQPYIQKVNQFESQLQTATAQTQSYQSEFSSFFGNLMQHASSTPTATAH